MYNVYKKFLYCFYNELEFPCYLHIKLSAVLRFSWLHCRSVSHRLQNQDRRLPLTGLMDTFRLGRHLLKLLYSRANFSLNHFKKFSTKCRQLICVLCVWLQLQIPQVFWIISFLASSNCRVVYYVSGFSMFFASCTDFSISLILWVNKIYHFWKSFHYWNEIVKEPQRKMWKKGYILKNKRYFRHLGTLHNTNIHIRCTNLHTEEKSNQIKW